MEDSKVEIVSGVHVAKDSNGTILYVEFTHAKRAITQESLAAIVINSTYDPDVDALYLQFADRGDCSIASTEHYQYDILLDKNSSGRFLGLEIQFASKTLCKNITKTNNIFL